MNPNSTRIRPAVAPDEPEWSFPPGFAQVVINVPRGDGEWEVYRLTEVAPTDPVAREFARALLRAAATILDHSEPANPNAAVAR